MPGFDLQPVAGLKRNQHGVNIEPRRLHQGQLQAQRLADERRITEPKLQADRRGGRDRADRADHIGIGKRVRGCGSIGVRGRPCIMLRACLVRAAAAAGRQCHRTEDNRPDN